VKRTEALKSIAKAHPGATIVFSNGLTSREAAHILGLGQYFFMLHAMGEAFAVGLGLSRARPNDEIVVVEGDGNARMGAASWCMPPKNMAHYILVNGVHETTGRQSIAPSINFPEWVRIVHIDEGVAGAPNPPSPADIIKAFSKWMLTRGNAND